MAPSPAPRSSHLDELEAESITIMREVAAQFEKPVMLYSIGKDSSVMLHLAVKAFWPAKPPFPLLHVDTTWKFKEMIAFRDRRAAELELELIVHVNEDGLRAGVGPFTHTDPRDRPPEIFAAANTLHFSPTQPAYLLLPIIPPDQERVR